MKIIAIGHRQNVGKDTTAKLLMAQIKGMNPKISVVRMGFADTLKDQAEDMFAWAGLQPRHFYENHPEFKNRPLATIGRTPREIWLELGAAMNRLCPTIWCNLLFQQVSAQIVIIPDLRRLAEAEFIRRFPSYLIKINRPGTPLLEELMPNDPNRFLDSELAEYDGWYRTIENSGTTKDLNTALKPLAEEVMAAL